MAVLPLADLVHDIPVLGPIGVAVSGLTTVWSQAIAADPMRRGIVFSNPGTKNKLVAPANLSAQPAHNEGALLIYPGDDLVLFPEDEHTNINCAWMAWTADNADGVLSILNFTGNNPSVAAPEPLAYLNQGSVISSPAGSGVLLTTSSAPAIEANPVRRGIGFHNPGSINLSLCPSNLAAVAAGAGSILLLPGQTKTYMAKPKSRIRVNCGWNAIAAGGSNNPLSILEYLG